MIEITGKEQLEEFIWENFNNNKIVVIYFGADWCGPCQALKKKIASNEALSEMPDLIVGHLDIDDSKNEDVSERFSVKSLPTQIFVSLKGSQIIELKRIIGFDWSNFKMTYAEIDETRKKNINGEQPTELVKPDEPVGANSALYDI